MAPFFCGNTGGAGADGSFIGVEFLQGFDHLIVDAADNINGAFSIDDLYYEGNAPVPEPGTIFLIGSGMLGIAGFFHRNRKFL